MTSIQFPEGKNWDEWMQDYRFGALIFIPHGRLFDRASSLREEYDPYSARTSPPHLTITQPFARGLSGAEVESLRKKLESWPAFSVKIGPAIPSPNGRLVWFDVDPAETILRLRDQLHALGHFRTDLPFTQGFVPHLTISEKPREPDAVKDIVARLNQEPTTDTLPFDHLSWSVPDENFVFRERLKFDFKVLK